MRTFLDTEAIGIVAKPEIELIRSNRHGRSGRVPVEIMTSGHRSRYIPQIITTGSMYTNYSVWNTNHNFRY